mmetsp:Transcript_2505/g.4452  ORF Transcript_2505/g.4452 Transcript_2505/m.4452 type:complete len:219 (+) Transcript_2505:278-934(+)
MFAESYDPFGFDNPLYCGNPHSPHADEKRKRQENARRHRAIEAERRQRDEFERIQRMEEKLKIEDLRRQMEMWQWELEEEEELCQCRLDMLATRDDRVDDMSVSSCPPAFIHAGESQDELENKHSSHSSAPVPPRTILLKPSEHVSQYEKNKHNITRRRAGTENNNICTEEPDQAANNIDDDETSAPLHIIAVEDLSDDEEDEDLDSIWIDQAPDPGQ